MPYLTPCSSHISSHPFPPSLRRHRRCPDYQRRLLLIRQARGEAVAVASARARWLRHGVWARASAAAAHQQVKLLLESRGSLQRIHPRRESVTRCYRAVWISETARLPAAPFSAPCKSRIEQRPSVDAATRVAAVFLTEASGALAEQRRTRATCVARQVKQALESKSSSQRRRARSDGQAGP